MITVTDLFWKLMLLSFVFPILAEAQPPNQTPSGGERLNRPMAPGTVIPGKTLNVRSPNSDGWILMVSEPYGMVFGRKGHAPGEGDEAQVLVSPLSESEAEEKFIDYVKERVAKETTPKRFVLRQSDIGYTKDRKYPCVRADYTEDDTKARTSPTTTEKLLIESHALYCMHPTRKNIAFAAIYSHRGKKTDPAVRAAAADFIEHVVVSGD